MGKDELEDAAARFRAAAADDLGATTPTGQGHTPEDCYKRNLHVYSTWAGPGRICAFCLQPEPGSGADTLPPSSPMVEFSHRDGVTWYDAPRPWRFHRCRPHSTGLRQDGTRIDRCACGAIRYDGRLWTGRNTRVKPS